MDNETHANDEYEVTSALAGPPPPTTVFPEELAKQQSPEQGGDTGEGGAAHPAPDDTDQRGADAEGSGADTDGDGQVSLDEASREQLEAAVDDKELDVKGTGSNGYVTVDDMKSALSEAGVTSVAADPEA